MILSDPENNTENEQKLQERILQYMYSQDTIFGLEVTPNKLCLSNVSTSLEKVLNISHPTIIVVLDFTTSTAIQLGVSGISQQYLRNNTWLIVSPDIESLSDIKSFFGDRNRFSQRNVVLDTQLYILTGNASSYALFDVYKTCKDHPIILRKIDYFDKSQNDTEKPRTIWNRRNDLMGCSLRVAYVDELPFISRLVENDTSMDIQNKHVWKSGNVTMFGEGLNEIEILKLLTTTLNITVSWVHAEDNSYGVYNRSSRTWDGIIGLILNDQALTYLMLT